MQRMNIYRDKIAAGHSSSQSIPRDINSALQKAEDTEYTPADNAVIEE